MNNHYLGRYRTIAIIVAFMFVVLATRLFQLQIVDYEENRAAADAKKTKTITSRGSRGTIMDVNSLTLAYDKQVYNVQFYRDPNFVTTTTNADGRTQSQYEVYTNSIISMIDIVERNGGTMNTAFSLSWSFLNCRSLCMLSRPTSFSCPKGMA